MFVFNKEASLSVIEANPLLKRAQTLDQILMKSIINGQNSQNVAKFSPRPKKSKRNGLGDRGSVSSDSSVCQVMFSCEPIIRVSYGSQAIFLQ
jgi:hypothetical protein